MGRVSVVRITDSTFGENIADTTPHVDRTAECLGVDLALCLPITLPIVGFVIAEWEGDQRCPSF